MLFHARVSTKLDFFHFFSHAFVRVLGTLWSPKKETVVVYTGVVRSGNRSGPAKVVRYLHTVRLDSRDPVL